MVLVDPVKVQRYTEAGWWGSVTLWDLFVQHVRSHPDAPAVADACNRESYLHGPPRRLSWAGLSLEVDRMSGLMLDLGLTRDDIVIAQMPNCIEQFVVYLACARLGLIISPVPIQFREHELDQIVSLTLSLIHI